MNDDALIGLHAAALFTYNERGRMVQTNEPEPLPAPRVFLGCTATSFRARFGTSLSNASVQRLIDIVERWPPDGDLAIPPELRAAIQDSLAMEAPVASEEAGPVYRFPASIARPDKAIEITKATIEFARETFPWLYNDLDSWRPCFAVIADGAARSICFSSRVTASAMEAGVFTLPDYRGRRLAETATLAWGAAIQAMGRRAGLIRFGADASWR